MLVFKKRMSILLVVSIFAGSKTTFVYAGAYKWGGPGEKSIYEWRIMVYYIIMMDDNSWRDRIADGVDYGQRVNDLVIQMSHKFLL